MEVVDGDLGTEHQGVLNRWTSPKYSGMPPRTRSLHVGIVVGDALYIFGGYDGSSRVNDLYKFDFKQSKWMSIHTPTLSPSARDRHVAVAHGAGIYIFGGYDGNNRVSDFWHYDPEQQQWLLVEGSGQPPTPRHSHSGVEYNGSMYIFAGYDGNYRSDFHAFDFVHRKWLVVPVKGSAPKARYRTSAVSCKNKMLVVGGHDGAKHLNDFYQFDFDANVWSLIEPQGNAPAPSPRDSHSAVVYGDSMYLFGGSTGAARNDLYEFRFDTRQWREVRPSAQGVHSGTPIVPCPRFCHTGVVYSSALFVFGGYDGQNRLNDFWQFKLADEVKVEIPASSLISDLRQCLNEPRFSDITFVVEGKPVYAHKLLCMRCSYFRAMFEGQMKESQQKTVTINSISHNVFLALLEYLYTDEIEMSLELAMDLFVAADLFGVERLKRLCEKKIFGSIGVDSAARILVAASKHHATELRQSCLDFILRNFDAISKTAGFEEMGRNNVELMFEILKRR